MIIISASTAQAHLDCPRLALAKDRKEVSYEQTPAMAFGSWRHAGIESAITEEAYPPDRIALEGALERRREVLGAFAYLEDGVRDASEAVLALADRRDLWPPKADILSVEGSDLPPRFAVEVHGKRAFQLILSTNLGIRGIMDLVYVRGNVLVVRDWKGGRTDSPCQTDWYLHAASWIWPGFETYRMEYVYLSEGASMDAVEMTEEEASHLWSSILPICEIILMRRAGQTPAPPTANRWCSSCPLRGDCEEWQTALQPLVTEPAARRVWPTDLASLDVPTLVDTYLAFSTGRKAVEAYGDALASELKTRLSPGEKAILESGHGVRLQETAGGYDYDVAALSAWRSRWQLDENRVFRAATETDLKKAAARLTDETQRNECLAELDACRTPKRSVLRLVTVTPKGGR